jgi:hypothetical protein
LFPSRGAAASRSNTETSLPSAATSSPGVLQQVVKQLECKMDLLKKQYENTLKEKVNAIN